jgi:hypothetical protein
MGNPRTQEVRADQVVATDQLVINDTQHSANPKLAPLDGPPVLEGAYVIISYGRGRNRLRVPRRVGMLIAAR